MDKKGVSSCARCRIRRTKCSQAIRGPQAERSQSRGRSQSRPLRSQSVTSENAPMTRSRSQAAENRVQPRGSRQSKFFCFASHRSITKTLGWQVAAVEVPSVQQAWPPLKPTGGRPIAVDELQSLRSRLADVEADLFLLQSQVLPRPPKDNPERRQWKQITLTALLKGKGKTTADQSHTPRDTNDRQRSITTSTSDPTGQSDDPDSKVASGSSTMTSTKPGLPSSQSPVLAPSLEISTEGQQPQSNVVPSGSSPSGESSSQEVSFALIKPFVHHQVVQLL